MKLNVAIETKSPLHIGNGRRLSQFTDYIYKEGKVYYINHGELETCFVSHVNGEEMMEDYINTIKAQAGGSLRTKLRLKEFFEKYQLDINKYSARQIPSKGSVVEEIKMTSCCKGSPYVPGSSLKGAIRTALLYHHKKDMEIDIGGMKKGYSGADVFGDIHHDVMKYLYVSDSQPFEAEALEIIRLERYDLKKKTTSIPIVVEAVKPSKNTSCSIQLKAKKDIVALVPKFTYFYEDREENVEKLFHYINSFYMECIEKEIQRLKQHSSDTTRKITDFYNALLEEGKQLNKKKTGAILRIGAGKTYFENSIGNLFSKEMLRRIFQGNKKVNINCFPKTRTIASDGNHHITLPMGWIRIDRI